MSIPLVHHNVIKYDFPLLLHCMSLAQLQLIVQTNQQWIFLHRWSIACIATYTYSTARFKLDYCTRAMND